MGFLQGKRALIVGVASNRSIAWGIAKAMHREGAELAFTYQTDKLKPRVESIAEATGSKIVIPCDVAFDDQIDLRERLQGLWRYRAVVALGTLLGASAALIWGLTTPRTYAAQVALVVNQSKLDDRTGQPMMSVATFRPYIENASLAQKVIQEFGLHDPP